MVFVCIPILCLSMLDSITRRQMLGYSSAAAFIPVEHTDKKKTMKASVYIAITVDGYIAEKNGSVDFLNEYQSSASAADGDMGFADFLDTVDLLIMGRKTFDQVVSFGDDLWPYGDRQVWVWSRNPSSVKIPQIRLNNAVALSGEPQNLMNLAKQKGYMHVYVDGGETIQQFLQSDCINDLVLTRVPILLGEGVSLFSQTNRISLQHLSTRAYSNGLVQSHYRLKH